MRRLVARRPSDETHPHCPRSAGRQNTCTPRGQQTYRCAIAARVVRHLLRASFCPRGVRPPDKRSAQRARRGSHPDGGRAPRGAGECAVVEDAVHRRLLPSAQETERLLTLHDHDSLCSQAGAGQASVSRVAHAHAASQCDACKGVRSRGCHTVPGRDAQLQLYLQPEIGDGGRLSLRDVDAPQRDTNSTVRGRAESSVGRGATRHALNIFFFFFFFFECSTHQNYSQVLGEEI